MHVLTFTSLFPGSARPGHGGFVRRRMEAWAKATGHRWTVVAPVPYFPRLPLGLGARGPYGAYARSPRREQPWGYPIHHPRHLVTPKLGMRWYGAWMAAGARAAVRAIHAREPVDLIDAHYLYPDAYAALLLGRELGVPVVASARGTDLNLFPDFPPIRSRLRRTLAGCAQVICVSESLKRRALGLDPAGGGWGGKVHVIGNGVDPSLFHYREPAACREALGLAPGDGLILGVGNLVPNKGFHLLLAAAAAHPDRNLQVALAGEGPERARLESRARELGLGGRVRFLGRMENADLGAWMGAADLLALPSFREGWPNVLSEAQACGLPCLATDVGGVTEIIAEPWLGEVAERPEEACVTEALARALAKAWDRQRIAARGASRTWDRVALEVERVFRLAVP